MITNSQAFLNVVYGHELKLEGGNLVFPSLFQHETGVKIVDPTIVGRQSNNFPLETDTISYSGDLVIPNAANFADSSWISNGWNPDIGLLPKQLAVLIGNNKPLTDLNQLKNLTVIKSSVGGTAYTIALINSGNQGTYTRPGIITGADGALNVLSGTFDIPGNAVYQYSSINIASGATLRVTGNTGGWTEIGCAGDCVLNGTILCRAGYDGQQTHDAGTFTKTSAFELGTLSYTITQSNGGGGGFSAWRYVEPWKGSGGGWNRLAGGAQNLGVGGGGSSCNTGPAVGDLVILIPFVNASTYAVLQAPQAGTGISPYQNGGGGQGGQASGTSDSSNGYPVTPYGRNGGNGGYKGHHGKGLVLYVEGTLSGTGSINVSGRNGFNGGVATVVVPSNFYGSGGGGAGAGGSGGRAIVRYSAVGTMPAIAVNGGTAGSVGAATVGSNGSGHTSGTYYQAGTVGNAGAAGAAGSSSVGVIT